MNGTTILNFWDWAISMNLNICLPSVVPFRFLEELCSPNASEADLLSEPDLVLIPVSTGTRLTLKMNISFIKDHLPWNPNFFIMKSFHRNLIFKGTLLETYIIMWDENVEHFFLEFLSSYRFLFETKIVVFFIKLTNSHGARK